MNALTIDSGDASWLHDDASDAEGFFGDLARSVGKVAKSVAHTASDAVKMVGRAAEKIPGAKAIASVAAPVADLATKPLQFAALPATAAIAGLRGERVDKFVARQLHDQARAVQTWAAVVPGIGTIASGTLGAALALAEGQPIQDAALAGLVGALPGGPLVQKAVDVGARVGFALARGERFDKAALGALRAQLPAAARAGFDTALRVAQGERVDRALLAAAPELAQSLGPQLGNLAKSIAPDVAKTALQAFDTAKKAIRVADQAKRAIGNPQAILSLAGNALAPEARIVAQSLLANPALRALPLGEVATRLGRSPESVRQAMGALASAAQTIGREGALRVPALVAANAVAGALPPRISFDTALARFGSARSPVRYSPRPIGIPHALGGVTKGLARRIVRASPRLRAHGAFLSRALDASGLDGATYVVETGDSAWKIAQSIVGNGARWKELVTANPSKKTAADGNFATLLPGERLALPASWIGAAKAAPAPATSTSPVVPASVVTSNDAVRVADLATLARFAELNPSEAQPADFGRDRTDLALPASHARVKAIVFSFQKYANRTQNAGLATDGLLGPNTHAALVAYALKIAAQSAPALPASVPAIPSIPVVPGLPFPIPTPTAPTIAVPMPAPVIVPVPMPQSTIPAPNPAAVPASWPPKIEPEAPPATSTPATPPSAPVAAPAAPTTPSAPAAPRPSTEAKSGFDSALPWIAALGIAAVAFSQSSGTDDAEPDQPRSRR